MYIDIITKKLFAPISGNTDKSSFPTQVGLAVGCLFRCHCCYTIVVADLRMRVGIRLCSSVAVLLMNQEIMIMGH